MSNAGDVLKEIGSAALHILVDVNKFFEKMNKIEGEFKNLVAKFKGLGQIHEIEPSDSQSVITVFDAKSVIENLRVEHLEQRIKLIFETVKHDMEILLFLIHPTSDPGTKLAASLIPGAARALDEAEKKVQAVFQAMDTAVSLIKAFGQFLDLLDVLKDAEDMIDKKALTHGRRAEYVSAKFQFRTRVKGKRQDPVEIDQPGTQAKLNISKSIIEELEEALRNFGA